MPIINHHNLLSCQGQDDLHWEQCVRLLLVNPVPQLVNLQTYVNKIIENILAHPTEEKYLKLRYNNATLQKNIFSINGGQELLLSIGFQFDIDPVTNEKFLIFPILPMMSLEKNQQFHQKLPQEIQDTSYSEYIDRLQSCEQWLQNTMSVCLQLQQTKKESLKLEKGLTGSGRDFEEIPADSIIQLQLPTSKSAIGGFMKGDTFFDVWKFACSYFTHDRHDLVELRLPHEPHNVLKEDYSQTIVELGFLPRTKFIVTALDANQMENSKLVKGRAIAVEAVAVDRKKLYDEKMKKKEEQLAKENERKRAIQAFKDDRLERKLKGSILTEDDNKEEENPTKVSSSTALTPSK